MRDYGVVSPKFWIGGTGKSLRGNQEAQIVALYLMTSPHANMIGVFYCPLSTIAKETGLTLEGASEGLQSLIEADFANFDHETEEVFAVRMAAYQVGEQLEAKDNRCKGVAKELDRVMSDRLKAEFRAIYSRAFHLPEVPPEALFIKTPSQAPSEPPRSQKQEQKQEQKEIPNQPTVGSPPDGEPAKYAVPDCPHQVIVDAYHELLPTLPRVEVWSEGRQAYLRSRWREVCAEQRYTQSQGIEWFRDFFAIVGRSLFLTGKSPPKPGGRPFLADLEWLVKPSNFVKVIEGKYQ